MLKSIQKFAIHLVLGIFLLNANAATANPSGINETEIVVSTSDLIFDQNNILANVNGSWHLVRSLERIGSQWIAGVEVESNNLNYCPEGHPLCGRCKLCHLKKCRYYVSPCWQ